MVANELSEAGIDLLFRALADPTRRDLLARAAGGDYSVSGLAEHYEMSFAAVQKHVAVLERARLVTKEKRGREQIVRADPEGLQRARRLLEEYELIWRQRADRIAAIFNEG